MYFFFEEGASKKESRVRIHGNHNVFSPTALPLGLPLPERFWFPCDRTGTWICFVSRMTQERSSSEMATVARMTQTHDINDTLKIALFHTRNSTGATVKRLVSTASLRINYRRNGCVRGLLSRIRKRIRSQASGIWKFGNGKLQQLQCWTGKPTFTEKKSSGA